MICAPPRETAEAAERREWWRDRWLLDTDGSARWRPVDRLAQLEAPDLAERYHGVLVRLTAVPSGYEDILSWDAPARTAVHPGQHGIAAVLTAGWPGAPELPPGAVLIGPVSFLAAALRRVAVRRGVPQ